MRLGCGVAGVRELSRVTEPNGEIRKVTCAHVHVHVHVPCCSLQPSRSRRVPAVALGLAVPVFLAQSPSRALHCCNGVGVARAVRRLPFWFSPLFLRVVV